MQSGIDLRQLRAQMTDLQSRRDVSPSPVGFYIKAPVTDLVFASNMPKNVLQAGNSGESSSIK